MWKRWLSNSIAAEQLRANNWRERAEAAEELLRELLAAHPELGKKIRCPLAYWNNDHRYRCTLSAKHEGGCQL